MSRYFRPFARLTLVHLIALSLVDCKCGDDPDPPGGGDAGSMDVVLGRDLPRPKVDITEPLQGAQVPADGVTVAGTVEGATEVTVRGVTATIQDGRFTARVVLRDGDNLILAEARNTEGGTGSDAVNVSVDSQPPIVAITRPSPHETFIESEVVVIGSVRDPGAYDRGLTVTVDDIPAVVRQSDFVARVPLRPGRREIVAVAQDAAGNRAFAVVPVEVRKAVGPTVRIISGDAQEGLIGSLLPAPLTVELRLPDGAPAARRRVEFEVTRGDGLLFGGPGVETRRLLVDTSTSGRASVRFRIGRRASASGNIVTARAQGFDGAASFIAGGRAKAAQRIHPDLGANQRGATEERLAKPFVAKVLDEAANPIAGVDVVFAVTSGKGVFSDGMPMTTVRTDENGHARAVLKLGKDEGLANNVVSASFQGNRGAPAMFTATAVHPGKVEETRITGEILDMAQKPIPNVLVRIDHEGSGKTFTRRTDAMGGFALKGVPSGLYTIVVDPTDHPEPYPKLNWELVALAGRNNRLERPMYLPKLDLRNTITVDENTGGVLTIPELPGVSVEVAPGSATFPDGSKRGTLVLTLVNHDRVPMTPPGDADGVIDLSIQPGGTVFNPPARVSMPNIEGDPPGTIANLVSFNHGLGQFVPVGTMVVSEDGSRIVSEPGQGLPFAGWHTRQTPEEFFNLGGGCELNPQLKDALEAAPDIPKSCGQLPPGACADPCSSGCALEFCNKLCGGAGGVVNQIWSRNLCITVCGPACLDGMCAPGCTDKIKEAASDPDGFLSR